MLNPDVASTALNKLEIGLADALKRRGRAVEPASADGSKSLTSKRSSLSLDEKLKLTDELRAMTPHGVESSDSTLNIRCDRDTGGGDRVDDGWSDDDRH